MRREALWRVKGGEEEKARKGQKRRLGMGGRENKKAEGKRRYVPQSQD